MASRWTALSCPKLFEQLLNRTVSRGLPPPLANTWITFRKKTGRGPTRRISSLLPSARKKTLTWRIRPSDFSRIKCSYQAACDILNYGKTARARDAVASFDLAKWANERDTA